METKSNPDNAKTTPVEDLCKSILEKLQSIEQTQAKQAQILADQSKTQSENNAKLNRMLAKIDPKPPQPFTSSEGWPVG
jgi:hypothetical protein